MGMVLVHSHLTCTLAHSLLSLVLPGGCSHSQSPHCSPSDSSLS
jgi:hypothetical protein